MISDPKDSSWTYRRGTIVPWRFFIRIYRRDICMVVALLLVTYVPAISMTLPTLLMGA